MSKPFRLTMAKQGAEALVREFGIDSLAVDPFAVAARRGIVVEPKADAAEGVSGMLLRHGNVFGILYSTQIESEGFQRFSIAHELGHYFLDGHVDHVLPADGYHASRAGFASNDPYELEADHFAAGLLMPSHLVRRELRKHEPGLAAIESLATLCKTSLTATAIRYAELSEDAVAVVMSTGPYIDYCCLSNTMKTLPQLTWLKKGFPVPQRSETLQISGNPDRVARGDRSETEINIMDWLGGVRSAAGYEEVVGLGSYGKTLTVLTCPSLVDETFRDADEEDENDDEMIDRWTPRFSR